ncbi:MAG: type II toxin-antitoxin system RelE/ParE family toxin [Bacteroidota bacterium]
MAKVIRSAKARNDLKDIFNYIADNSSESRATKLLKQLEHTMQQLADSPGMGTDRSYLAPRLLGFPSGKYIIFYQISGDDIQIVRVLHGRRDIENIF